MDEPLIVDLLEELAAPELGLQIEVMTPNQNSL